MSSTLPLALDSCCCRPPVAQVAGLPWVGFHAVRCALAVVALWGVNHQKGTLSASPCLSTSLGHLKRKCMQVPGPKALDHLPLFPQAGSWVGAAEAS